MKGPSIIVIAAVGEENRVIGNDLKLPWHISEDLKRFKALTDGYPLIMGRKTYESLIDQFGRQLPNRPHFVLTSKPSAYSFPEAEVFTDLKDAIDAGKEYDKLFIAGGAAIYKMCLEMADVWELTIVEGHHEGNVFFPEYEHLIGRSHKLLAIENRGGYRFETFTKMEMPDLKK